MKLFKNGVGRPTNETIKKRRIFVIVITLLVLATVAGASFLLTNITTKKILGASKFFNSLNIGKVGETWVNFDWKPENEKKDYAKSYVLYRYDVDGKTKEKYKTGNIKKKEMWKRITDLEPGVKYMLVVKFNKYCNKSEIKKDFKTLPAKIIKSDKIRSDGFNFSWAPQIKKGFNENFKAKRYTVYYSDDSGTKLKPVSGFNNKSISKDKTWIGIKGLAAGKTYVIELEFNKKCNYRSNCVLSDVVKTSGAKVNIGKVRNDGFNFNWAPNNSLKRYATSFTIYYSNEYKTISDPVSKYDNITLKKGDTWKEIKGLAAKTYYVVSVKFVDPNNISDEYIINELVRTN